MKAIKIITIISITLLFLQCAGSKFDKKPPFNIQSSTYYKNINGIHKNTLSYIYIRYTSKDNIQFDSLYFRKNKIKIQIKTIEGLKYAFGEFKKNSISKDFTLDANPIKELKNPIPNIQKFPFNLKDNEAVIKYQQKGKTKFFKIKDIQKQESDSLLIKNN
ncbi:hypothetical protein [Polaribacter sp. L3A8]|uniref:hypothetical protein n=1 Tax=Polaribacter sp. L3A8 TaxID=2686361 RepID=UPI00131BBD0F|nr:hypothetical protein [Polaribacter sp. L3A8]